MSKRPGSSDYSSADKRQRIDDIWGDDDFDLDQIEECIIQATQRVEDEEKLHNSTLQVPSTFTDFNKTSGISMASTQKSYVFGNLPSSSRATVYPKVPSFNPSQVSNHHLKFQQRNSSTENVNASFQTVICKDGTGNVQSELLKEIERLKLENEKMNEKCMVKEGEVSILRQQLKQTQKVVDNVKLEKIKCLEQQKLEWSEKISALNHVVNSKQADIELKDMDLRTLRERCRNLESAKKFNETLTQTQPTGKFVRPNEFNEIRESKAQSSKFIQTIPEKCSNAYNPIYYPITPEIYRQMFQKFTPRVDNQNLISFSVCKETNSKLNSLLDVTIKLSNGHILSLNYIKSELDDLKTLTVEELDSPKAVPLINKLVFVCQELILKSLQLVSARRQVPKKRKFLKEHQSYAKSIPKQTDLFDNRLLCDSESSILVRQVVSVLATLVKYNSRLQKYISGESAYITGDKSMTHTNECFTEVNNFKIKEDNEDFLFLKIILVYINALRRHNCSNHSSGVIISILDLLSNCIKKNNFSRLGKMYISRILKDIVLSCPPFAVLCYVTNLITSCSNQKEFFSFLCRNATNDCFSNKPDYIYFNDDSCILQLYAGQLETYIHENFTELWVLLKQTYALTLYFYNQYLENPESINNTECQCSLTSMHCYFKFLNVSLLKISNFKQNFMDYEMLKFTKKFLEKTTLMVYIFVLTKVTEVYKLFLLHRMNIHILKELAEKFELDNDLKTILEELEAENDFQSTCNSGEVFREDLANSFIKTNKEFI